MVAIAANTKGAGALVFLAVAGIIACISTGQLKVPLPAPAVGKYVHLVPKGVLPWEPQPLEGAFAPNSRLLAAVRLFEGQIQGAESIAVKDSGDLVLLDKFGDLFEAAKAAGADSWSLPQTPLAQLGGGRPLGYHLDAAGDLIICDSVRGLVKYDFAAGRASLLSSRVSASSALDPGSEVTYANDLAIAADGKVYFTSCSDIVPAKGAGGFYDTFRAWSLDLAQGLPTGRLLRYDPATQETIVLAKGLYYPNGVALAADESYLVVAETNRIRLVKYWIKGPKAGTYEPLLEHLPGAPDGVSSVPGPGNAFWVALVNPVPGIAAVLRDPVVRALYAWLPSWARPPVKVWGAVAKVSGDDGKVLDFLQDPTGEHISGVSAAIEAGGKLFLGNLPGNYISYVQLDTTQAAEAAASAAAAVDAEAVPAAPAASPTQEQEQEKDADFDPDVFYDDSDDDDDEAAAKAAAARELLAAGGGRPRGRSCSAAPAASSDGTLTPDAKAALFVNGKISKNKVVVFSKSYCPFCRKAKAALATLLEPEQITVVELDQLPGDDAAEVAPAIQDLMEELTGARSVPRVFIAAKFVGGGDDTAAKLESGELQRLLERQGLTIKQQQE